MVEHLVLIRWKDSTPQTERLRILTELAALRDVVPGIVHYRVGDNFSERSQGYHAAISSTFTDEASLAAYGPHPRHQQIAAQLRTATDSLIVVDFRPL